MAVSLSITLLAVGVIVVPIIWLILARRQRTQWVPIHITEK